MSHSCHAINCNKNVPPEMFMCKKHWYMVPKHLRDSVWAFYRPGQCDDFNISAGYAEAAKDAIKAVAGKEGIVTDDSHPNLALYDTLVVAQQALTSKGEL
jgi:hypothetical protein